MEYLQTFFAQYGALLAQGTWDTIVMSLVSTALAYVIGIPLGVFLVLTDPKKGLLPHKAVNAVLGWIVNIGRSIPFIILLVAIIPFTRLVVGTSLGVPGAVVPLVVAALIRGFSIVLITLLGYSAMAGTVGAGGLGDIAIRYGYQRYMVDVMIATIIILIVLVQIVQSGCDLAARKIDRKK